MKIYVDAFSGEEIVSDSFNMEEKFEGVIGEVQSQDIVKGAINVDVGAGGHFGGKNEDEEEGGVEDQAQKVNNIIDAFKYAETQFTKADYVTYFKAYAKKVKAYLEANKPDRVASFQKGAGEFIKWVSSNFNDLQFYCPESYDMENHIVLGYYKEGQASPTFVYILDGLKEVKM
ncbi:unnamed protein product [Paramecium primaurelia]|uniref:TCTP domain-containing protein n=1 Tax=Paramecium primaurelia TaxID=5886 RepID=A0A8S1LZK0_PARPR|nr:unnamed protein product [Paramecium primaurelia]